MSTAPLLIGIETGGTKVVAAVAAASAPETILATTTLPTRGPDETLAGLAAFVRDPGVEGTVAAVGMASFGPLDVDPSSPPTAGSRRPPSSTGRAPTCSLRSEPRHPGHGSDS
ncbi:ROK family protein [Rathayibacter oskolensis]|uniref:ROK family protein n=1 Tax=Rathayibacter oskolensis TaxID=1891671 RepID=UPI00265F9758|nr:ROK family protein [Rathayibacter oskolensis]WKK73078.1 ROK family protein [Rathayibacter oskolensis]